MITQLFEFFLGDSTIQSPAYDDSIFRFVGVCILITPAILSAFFYMVLNGFSNFAYCRKKIHWFLILLLNILVCVVLSIVIAKAQTESEDVTAYMIGLAVLTGITSGLLFFLFSLYFKRHSMHAEFQPISFTPFNKK